jgi:4-oxalmesaconate hydratase
MIIDVHAHYTQAPPQLDAYRGRQMSALNKPVKGKLSLSDEVIAQSLKGNLAQMQERGITHMMFSPRASGMNHDVGGELVSRYWSEINNDLIAQVCRLFPQTFSPVCQLPQSPGIGHAGSIEELRRCVNEMGFVACNINPDVSGGLAPLTPSLGDEWWYPLWEAMVALDVPGMIHASSTQHPGQHLNGSHYINWDTAAVVELCNSRVFEDFPKLKLIIPHAGGSTPFQFNRQRSLNALRGKRPFEEMVRHLYFDLAIYDQDSMEMTIRKLGADRVLYATEMFGTAKAVDPRTGLAFDDTVGMVRAIPGLSEADQALIFHGNAQRLYSRAKWKTV